MGKAFVRACMLVHVFACVVQERTLSGGSASDFEAWMNEYEPGSAPPHKAIKSRLQKLRAKAKAAEAAVAAT